MMRVVALVGLFVVSGRVWASDEFAELLVDVPAKVADSKGLRYEDRDAYFAVLAKLSATSPDELARLAGRYEEQRRVAHVQSGSVNSYSLFADLLTAPEWWQGKPVRISGHANRVVRYDPGTNEHHIDGIYESWIVTDDSLQFPTVVVARRLPAGATVGESAVQPLAATGIFFQLFTYQARDGKTRYAPLVLADSVTRPKPPRATSVQWLVAGVVSMFAIAVGVGVWSRDRRRRSRPGTMLELPPEEFSDND